MIFAPIFGSSKQLLFLTRNGFLLFSNKFPAGIQFNFSPNAVDDEEVINQEILARDIASFTAKNQIKPGKLIIMLSGELLFEKNFTSADQKKLDNEISLFLSEIPFKNIAKKIFYFDKQTYVIATNQDLYQTIKSIFEKKGWKIEAVVPASLFKDQGNKEAIVAKGFKRIVSNNQLIKQGNLLTEKEKKSSFKFSQLIKNQTVKTAVVFLFASIPTAFFIFTVARYMKDNNELPSSQITSAQPTTTLTPRITVTFEITGAEETTSAANLLELKKSLRIQVLNGSGIAGEASRTAKLLAEAGFTFNNISTGNADQFTYTDTVVSFKEDLSDIIFSQIKEILQDYTVVQSDPLARDEEFDIRIIVGKRQTE